MIQLRVSPTKGTVNQMSKEILAYVDNFTTELTKTLKHSPIYQSLGTGIFKTEATWLC